MKTTKFNYKQQELKNFCDDVINKALNFGATKCKVEINEIINKDISVLNQSIEQFEAAYGCSVSIVVFIGNKKGSSAVTSISPQDIDGTIKHAIDIAKYTEEDDANIIPDKPFLANNDIVTKMDLDLYHDNIGDNKSLIDELKELEQMATTKDKSILVSDGASINASFYNFRLANSNGFNSGYMTTRYNKSISLIAKIKDTSMQTDFAYSTKRDYTQIDSNQYLADMVYEKINRRLHKGTIDSGTYNIIFESDIAKSIIGNFFAAINGNNIFRNLSFLNNSINQKILPKWVSIYEDPFERQGIASCFFDNEGVMVTKKYIVTNGVLNNYLLNSYTAKKLGMGLTGNAGGTHNVYVSHNFVGDIHQLAKELYNGIIIIDTIGHGVNIVTGDYSVGASGLIVTNGTIGNFIDSFTISGNLKYILNNIKYIANDNKTSSSINCGSMLVEGLKIASNQ